MKKEASGERSMKEVETNVRRVGGSVGVFIGVMRG